MVPCAVRQGPPQGCAGQGVGGRAPNRGAAGIDRVTLEDAEEYGIARLLGVFLVLTMMVGPKISPEGVVAEERRGKAVADLARESGIEHLVYRSLNGASARSGIPYYESKARIEERIHALRLPATILRPVSFMDNFATYNRPVLDDGELVVSLAVRPELPMQLISVRDIGAFAAIAFDRPDQFLGRTVEIAGDVLTPPQIAETFGRVCGLGLRTGPYRRRHCAATLTTRSSDRRHHHRRPAPALPVAAPRPPQRSRLAEIHGNLAGPHRRSRDQPPRSWSSGEPRG